MRVSHHKTNKLALQAILVRYFMSISVGILKRCIEEARKSTFDVKIGCVIFKGNNIISSAYNQIRSCSAISIKHRKWANSLHAEQAAILNAGDWNKLKGCSMLVMKVSKTKEILSNAKPCEFCEATIRYVGIKNVYYTNEDGEIVKL
jgi:deoxycytidylate deaminase